MSVKLRFISLFISSLVLFSCSKDETETTVVPEVKILSETSTDNFSSITKTGALIQATVIKEGSHKVTERGLVLDTLENPSLTKGLKVFAGYGVGKYEVWANNLKPGKTYFVKAYAISTAGISFGKLLSFTTLSAPFVDTKVITNITSTTAVGGGNVTSDFGKQVTERGVCWSKIELPTISSSKLASDTQGLGEFEITLKTLEKNTEYYVRAYAKSELGVGYGKQIKFKTAE